MNRLRIVAALVLVFYLLASSCGSGQRVSVSAAPVSSEPVKVQNSANLNPSADFNATNLWGDIWNAASRQSLLNYTRNLSQNYPGRTWNELDETPSVPLQNAWAWANGTLKNNTGGQLAFHQVTDHKVLLAIKSGMGPSPRQPILVTGVISSGPTPGANDVGSSVAAVLEIARVLQNYTLYCDVYYVLTNRDTNNLTTDTGAKAFVSWLNQTKTVTVTSLSFERILFDDIGFLYGTEIMLRSYSGSSEYQEQHWIRDLLMELSASRGAGRVHYATDHGVAQRSMAYELWQAGRPAIHVSQGYWYDTYRDTSNDVWSNGEYSYDKAREIAACAACVVAYIGMLGESAASFYMTSPLNPLGNISELFTFTFNGFVNATVRWTGNTTIVATIADAYSHRILYQRTGDSGVIVVRYLSRYFGPFNFSISDIGAGSALVKVATTFLNDIDADGLSDTFEISKGTSPYSADTDQDGLTDDVELSIGTSPTNPDIDGDGAPDGWEVKHGSNPLVADTDGDGLSDGVEMILGTDPTKRDTDGDGLDDGLEVNVYHTNPLIADTDADGLPDGVEVALGLNPLSPDTDKDGLSDMFEVVNGLNPKSNDTDGDGLGDAYEVEYCLSPTNPDTDFDGIPDGIDWNPREHWIVTVAPAALLTTAMLFVVYAFLKQRAYKRDGTVVQVQSSTAPETPAGSKHSMA